MLFLLLAPLLALGADDALEKFDAMLAAHPDQIWAPAIDEKLKKTIRDYDAHAPLAKGQGHYGDSVRGYSLKGKCASEIERDMKKMGCEKRVDAIKEPVHNTPIVFQGKTSPIWQFVCADGGVVKVKPEGDPSSRFTPFPHASRTLYYPAGSEYRDYRDEVAKVSEDGHIVPRAPADLAPKELVDGWSKESHIPIGKCR